VVEDDETDALIETIAERVTLVEDTVPPVVHPPDVSVVAEPFTL
jgi:hypothetical protein